MACTGKPRTDLDRIQKFRYEFDRNCTTQLTFFVDSGRLFCLVTLTGNIFDVGGHALLSVLPSLTGITHKNLLLKTSKHSILIFTSYIYSLKCDRT